MQFIILGQGVQKIDIELTKLALLTLDSMGTIKWKWDDETNEWDPYTLLGTIQIVGENGESIVDNCTILDIWIKPLFNGLIKIKDHKESKFDLIDESSPLEFKIIDHKKYIRYGSNIAELKNIDRLLSQLNQICIQAKKYIMAKDSIVDRKALDSFNYVIDYLK